MTISIFDAKQIELNKKNKKTFFTVTYGCPFVIVKKILKAR